MSVGVVLGLCFAGLFIGAPVLLVLWARRAQMYSGRHLSYDGPAELVNSAETAGHAQPAPVEPPDEGGPEEGGPEEGVRLSPEEEAQWKQLTSVSWRMPERRDERA